MYKIRLLRQKYTVFRLTDGIEQKVQKSFVQFYFGLLKFLAGMHFVGKIQKFVKTPILAIFKVGK